MSREEVFEISDFTTASDWERFVSAFSQILLQWQCSSPYDWQMTSRETIRFSRISFDIHFHSKSVSQVTQHNNNNGVANDVTDQMMRCEEDFPSRVCHPLQRWFGLRAFVVVSPVVGSESVTTEDRARLLMSAVAIAAADANSALPVFCQLGERVRRLYAGVAVRESERTCFDCVHLSATPKSLRHMTALLALFRQKVDLNSKSNSILISIRFTYSLNQWPHDWTLDSAHSLPDASMTSQHLYLLEGVGGVANRREEPIGELQLCVTWPQLCEEVVIDSEVHSDLEPNSAPNWSLRVVPNTASSCQPLSDSLSALLRLKKSSTKEPLFGPLVCEPEVDFRHAFSRLTSQPEVTSDTNTIREIFSVETPEVANEELKTIIGLKVKSAPFGCLSWRIAIALANTYFRSRDVCAMANTWRAIVQELRKCWEERRPILEYRETDPKIDLGMSLLHQKLQMLNHCIRAQKREEESREEWMEESEEFFDCIEDTSGGVEEVVAPEGRVGPCGDLRLLGNSRQLVYIPETQENCPMTEDMVSSQLAVLQQLGTSAESAVIRARMQSASLQSDMEAFKAANVGAAFEDFVRWHSPRDWSEGSDGRGLLSERFEAKDNMWRQMWRNSRALSARKQKRLFDSEAEAEKVLHFLSSLTLETFIDVILHILVHSSILQLYIKTRDLRLTSHVDLEKLTSIGRHWDHVATSDEAMVERIRKKERKVSQFQSLIHKFSIAAQLEDHVIGDASAIEIRKLVSRLLSEPEVEISSTSATEGQLIRRMFSESQVFIHEMTSSVGERALPSHLVPPMPQPVAKEFIFRVRALRPHSYSRESPQRMYCLLSDKEFRICGAFSEDLTFF